MNCWHCNTELIWGGDHDLDDEDDMYYSMVTNLSCPRCKSYVEVYIRVKIKMTKSFTKLKHQVKSSRYYLFWGAATIAVMAGQIYVGNGYRGMSESVKDLTETITIKMEWDELRRGRGTGPYIPMVNPDDYIIWETIENYED